MSDAGFIYAIGAEGTSFVKIGSTKSPVEHRLRQLQTGQPLRLYLLAAIPVTQALRQLEKELHGLLAPYKHGGEWFDYPIDLPSLKRLMGKAIQQLQAQRPILNTPDSCAPCPWTDDFAYRQISFGERVTHIRTKYGTSQAALALRADVPLEMIERIENGLIADPSLQVALRLCKALGTTMDMLSGLVADMAHGLYNVTYYGN